MLFKSHMSRVKNTLDKYVLLISTTTNYFNIQKDFSEANKYFTRSSLPKKYLPWNFIIEKKRYLLGSKNPQRGSERYLKIGPNQFLVNYKWDHVCSPSYANVYRWFLNRYK